MKYELTRSEATHELEEMILSAGRAENGRETEAVERDREEREERGERKRE